MRVRLLILISSLSLFLVACAAESGKQPSTDVMPSAQATAGQSGATSPQSRQTESGIYDMHPVGQVILGVVAGVALFVGVVIFAVASASDARLKTDIRRVGTARSGLPLYTFRYRNGRTYWRGVMAQDVLKVRPDAVRVGKDGFYRVYYWKLGLRMTRARNLEAKEARHD